MSLCDLCRAIPWETLPTVPPNLPCQLSGFPYIQITSRWPKGERGYPHHQSLDALREAAQVCDVCRLICQSAENVQKELEEVKPQWEAGETKKYAWPTWEMWLVKRRDGGDGCWVMSFVQDENRKPNGKTEEAWMVAALGLCAKHGDPLVSVIRGRPIEESGGTPGAIERARKWLSECNEHPNCVFGETELPSRVIDVGEDIASPEVHLREPTSGTMGKYISLSYCWGESQVFTTTKSTIEDRKRGILVVDMPSTYQNIVTLSRALGIRYVWIDSLCICQDDHENWERESAKMLSIYSNAYLTVSASRAKGKVEGFFGTRPEREYVQLEYTREGIQGHVLAFALPLREELIKHDYITMPHEPLSERGWGVQERVLSRRLLHYACGQLCYECNEGFQGEDGLILPDRFDSVHKTLEKDPDRMFKVLPTEGVRTNARPDRYILKGWYDLLWHYGPKKLSHPSDKLPAISGLASMYAERIGGDYLAGLWRQQLIEGLLWQSLSFRRVSEYRAPSWSWASGNGIPATGLHVDYDEVAEILDTGVTLKGANRFGEVTDGWIKLRAPMEQLTLLTENWDPEAPGHVKYANNPKVRTSNGDEKGGYARFDFAFTADDAPQEAKKIVKSLEGVKIFALVLAKAQPWTPKTESKCTYHSLIVRESEKAGHYQRLGFLHSGEDMLGGKPEEIPKDDLPVITLI